jgi:hypothetical protein
VFVGYVRPGAELPAPAVIAARWRSAMRVAETVRAMEEP